MSPKIRHGAHWETGCILLSCLYDKHSMPPKCTQANNVLSPLLVGYGLGSQCAEHVSIFLQSKASYTTKHSHVWAFPQEMKIHPTTTCMQCIAALCIITPNWKQLKYASMNKMCCVSTVTALCGDKCGSKSNEEDSNVC
jgi:hypothetical protein